MRFFELKDEDGLRRTVRLGAVTEVVETDDGTIISYENQDGDIDEVETTEKYADVISRLKSENFFTATGV